MASPAATPSTPQVPPPDPQAIRSCLPPELAAEFDDEWAIVLDRVKQSMKLGDLHELLNKWRHTAYMEQREPGSYRALLAKAEQIQRTGRNPAGATFEDMLTVIRQRQASA